MGDQHGLADLADRVTLVSSSRSLLQNDLSQMLGGGADRGVGGPLLGRHAVMSEPVVELGLINRHATHLLRKAATGQKPDSRPVRTYATPNREEALYACDMISRSTRMFGVALPPVCEVVLALMARPTRLRTLLMACVTTEVGMNG
jgi:hypothetical protein